MKPSEAYDVTTIPILVLTGCTGSGKSTLALELAKEVDGYIINADSKQVYKEIPIGTAQPTPDEIIDDMWIIDGIEHYLYGHTSIQRQYTISDYQEDVFKLLLSKKGGELPILVGGSGLYIDSIIHNFQLDPEEETSNRKREEFNKLSISELQKLIGSALDTLNESDQSNPRRLIRLLERKASPTKGEQRDYQYFVIERNPEELNIRIEKRVEEMFEEGLENEARKFEEEIIAGKPTMEIIGYREFKDYFKGEIPLEDVKELIIIHTRQYAKRQKTWFRKEKNAIVVTSLDQIKAHLRSY